jgi:hypothetical protein
MYSVQVLNGNRWEDVKTYQPRPWNDAVQLFTHYMERFQMHDYRIFPVVTLPEVK